MRFGITRASTCKSGGAKEIGTLEELIAFMDEVGCDLILQRETGNDGKKSQLGIVIYDDYWE